MKTDLKTEQQKLREQIPLDDAFLSDFFKERNLPHYYDSTVGLWTGFEQLKIAADWFQKFC